MKISKNSLRYIIVILLFTLMMSPAMTIAQTYSTSSATSSNSWWFYNDVPSESRSARQQRIQEYRQQSSALQQKISALGNIANTSVIIPILFGVEVKNISPNFGDPRSGDRLHEGEDMMAVKGTPIVSPTPAVVLRAGLGGSEGNYVYTANPGGETFVYMHLDRIGEGVVSGLVLNQGSLIGYVGNTGNASGGAAHLHFEIHNSSNVPVDPFPRLTGEFSLQEKISYLSLILTQTSDSVALSELLITNFRSTFTAAISAGIALPLFITNALASIPETSIPVNTGGVLPVGDLDIGSKGTAVIALQKYLIQSALGISATQLSYAGATGYFGPITKAALIEFQITKNISPASGYYGPVTQIFIATHPLGTSTPNNQTASSTITFTRNLYRGVIGEDARTLQKLLNANGYTVAPAGLAGSLGNETIYFGPATEAAVIKFQITNNISPAVGYFGPITRAVLISLLND